MKKFLHNQSFAVMASDLRDWNAQTPTVTMSSISRPTHTLMEMKHAAMHTLKMSECTSKRLLKTPMK